MSCLISDKQSFILRRLFRSISGFRGDLVKNEMKMQVAKRQKCQGGIVIQKWIKRSLWRIKNTPNTWRLMFECFGIFSTLQGGNWIWKFLVETLLKAAIITTRGAQSDFLSCVKLVSCKLQFWRPFLAHGACHYCNPSLPPYVRRKNTMGMWVRQLFETLLLKTPLSSKVKQSTSREKLIVKFRSSSNLQINLWPNNNWFFWWALWIACFRDSR